MVKDKIWKIWKILDRIVVFLGVAFGCGVLGRLIGVVIGFMDVGTIFGLVIGLILGIAVVVTTRKDDMLLFLYCW